MNENFHEDKKKTMAKYKVEFSGFEYIEADSEEDARELFDSGEEVYRELGVDNVEEVDEFVVEI